MSAKIGKKSWSRHALIRHPEVLKTTGSRFFSDQVKTILSKLSEADEKALLSR